MNLPDELQGRRQQAMEEAMEMYKRAQKRARQIPLPSETSEKTPTTPQIEVEVVDQSFGERSLDYTEKVIDLPPQRETDREGPPPAEEDPALLKAPETQTLQDRYDWETEDGDQWKAGLSFQERVPDSPKESNNTPPAVSGTDNTNKERNTQRNNQTPADKTVVQSDKPSTNFPEQTSNNSSENNKSNQWHADTKSPTSRNAANPKNTAGYDEQYYRELETSPEAENQRLAPLPTDHPSYDHEKERHQSGRAFPLDDPVTRNQKWTDIEGYTEQYYENEETYEEFSTGHSEEQPNSADTVSNNTGKKPKSQRDTIRNYDVRYGNLKHQNNWKQKKSSKPSNSPQKENQLGDDALLWLLLMNLMEEENQNTELITALMYLLMG